MTHLGNFNVSPTGEITAVGWKTKLKVFWKTITSAPKDRRQNKFGEAARHLAHDRKNYLVIQADPNTDLVTVSFKDKVVVLQMQHRMTKKAIKYQHERFADYLLQAIDTGLKGLAGHK